MKESILMDDPDRRVLEISHNCDTSFVFDNKETGESVTMAITGEGVIIDLYDVDHDGHDRNVESIGWEWDDFVEMLRDKNDAIRNGSF